MAGRFPLYTDADVHEPLVEALIRLGWDVLRAVDAFPGLIAWHLGQRAIDFESRLQELERWHLPRGAEAQVRPQADAPA